MIIYLAGYICGSKINECSEWRRKIVEHYRKQAYPITWLDPLNGKNLESIDEKGLKSDVPIELIFSGDYLSIKTCDVVIANMDKFGESRDMVGTISEVAIAWMLQKPIIMITKDNNYRKHPFYDNSVGGMVNIFVESVEELLERKIINYYYKRVNDASYKD